MEGIYFPVPTLMRLFEELVPILESTAVADVVICSGKTSSC